MVKKSSYIFEAGKPIQEGLHGKHTYVYSGGEAVHDQNKSNFVFESGTGLRGVLAKYPMRGRTQDRSCQVNINGPTLAPTIDWKREIVNTKQSWEMVSDSIHFYVNLTQFDEGAILIAFDREGNEVWRKETTSGELYEAPVIDTRNGIVIWYDTDAGELLGLDQTDGSVIWANANAGKPGTFMAVTENDAIIYEGNIKVRTTDGTIIWTASSDAGRRSVGVPKDADADTFGQGAGSRDMDAYKKSDGSQVWSYDEGGPGEMSETVYDPDTGDYFLSAHEDNSNNPVVYRFNESDGTKVWEKTGFEDVREFVVPLIDKVIGKTFTGKLFALDKTDGSTLWTVNDDGDSQQEPIVDKNGRVFSRAGSHELAAYDEADGSKIWHKELNQGEGDYIHRFIPEAGSIYIFKGKGYDSGNSWLYKLSEPSTSNFTIGSLSETARIPSQGGGPSVSAWNGDGTKLYEANSDPCEIHSYTLSTAYDLNTASAHQTVSVDGGCPRDVSWNADGTKFYKVERNNHKIHEFSAGTTYDISTLSKNDALDVQSIDLAMNGMAWNDDGTKLFLIGGDDEKIYELDVSPAYDVSTATLSQSLSLRSSNSNGITFNDDGTRMFHTASHYDYDNDSIYYWTLDKAYDISTASLTNAVGIGTHISGCVWTATGDKLIVGEFLDDVLIEFDPSP